jgi:hypothetical protein
VDRLRRISRDGKRFMMNDVSVSGGNAVAQLVMVQHFTRTGGVVAVRPRALPPLSGLDIMSS